MRFQALSRDVLSFVELYPVEINHANTLQSALKMSMEAPYTSYSSITTGLARAWFAYSQIASGECA
jgi:hypothetical protein